MCLWWISKGFFQFGMQMQTTSLLPRLQAQCGSILYTARLQSGRWWYMSRDNQELRQSYFKLHRRTSHHLHVRRSCARRPHLNVVSIWEGSFSTHQQSLSTFTSFRRSLYPVLCGGVELGMRVPI